MAGASLLAVDIECKGTTKKGLVQKCESLSYNNPRSIPVWEKNPEKFPKHLLI